MDNNKRKSSYLLITLLAVILLFTALFICLLIPGQGVKNTINNEINNEITNTIVEYEKLTVEDVDKAISVAVKKVQSAVIGVTAKAVIKGSLVPSGRDAETNYGTGSGVIYKREAIVKNGVITNYKYYVITNRHVVTLDPADTSYERLNIYAYLGEEDVEISAYLVGYDEKVDIALLTFITDKYIQPVEFADSDTLEKGQLAIAIGNPGGYEYYGSVTFGVVSSPERYISTDTDDDGTDDFYAEYIQHDVAINPGNSGGGLFNLRGELIGINTLKLVDSSIDNMGFAIPSNVCQNIVTEYLELNKKIVRPKMGILGTEVRALTDAIIQNDPDILDIPNIYNGEKAYGIYVVEVYPDTTIAQTDIEKHDIMLSINGIKLTRMYIVNSKMNSLLEGFQVGEVVTVEYYDRSAGVIKTVDVELKP